MAHNNSITQKLSTGEPLELLTSQTFGRLIVRREDDVDLLPLSYVIHEGSTHFYTVEGSKLFTISLNHDVLFEADLVGKNAQGA